MQPVMDGTLAIAQKTAFKPVGMHKAVHPRAVRIYLVAETDVDGHCPIGGVAFQCDILDWHGVALCACAMTAQEVQHIARLASQARQFEPWHFKRCGLIVDLLNTGAQRPRGCMRLTGRQWVGFVEKHLLIPVHNTIKGSRQHAPA